MNFKLDVIEMHQLICWELVVDRVGSAERTLGTSGLAVCVRGRAVC
jgi:hypothetical protein